MTKFKLHIYHRHYHRPTLPVMAQRKRVSPHETISATIDGNKGDDCLRASHSKDPKTGEIRILGRLVPYGKVWRTGADEATAHHGKTDRPGRLMFRGYLLIVHVPSRRHREIVSSKVAHRAVGHSL